MVGFSTGALGKGDYISALNWLYKTDTCAVEISALRIDEFKKIVSGMDKINVKKFSYISFHMPSYFREDEEDDVLENIKIISKKNWNIVVHPDVIFNPTKWAFLGDQLLIENMDRRKRTGRTYNELIDLFYKLPKARLCLDLAHARQLDTTLLLLEELILKFKDRIAEIHISELDSYCNHISMSEWALHDYATLPWKHLRNKPIIIESMLTNTPNDIKITELESTRKLVNSVY